jgi:hypothetical protein
MEIKDYLEKLKELGACHEAMKWSETFITSQEAWMACEKGHWMLWLIGRLSSIPGSDKRKKLVLTVCKCARLTLPLVKEGELQPLKDIVIVEQWARGENNITLNDVQNAAYTAAYTSSAAYAAAYAAYAANAAYAAANAAANTVRDIKTIKQCADIVRVDYPNIDDLFEK